MNTLFNLSLTKQPLLKNSQLILIAFATAFFPRIINTIGLPATINFIHFTLVPLCCVIAILTTKIKLKKQIFFCKSLLTFLFLFLIIITISALLNQAGIINIILSFLLLTEPFILLLAIICLPISTTSLENFRNWIIYFGIINIVLALCQHFLITTGLLPVTLMQPEDNVQGVFYLSGSGHVVSASVSMSLALFNFSSYNNQSLLIKIGIFIAACIQLLFADAKQVIVVWLAAWLILILIKSRDFKTALQYLIAAIIVIWSLWWCIDNLPIFSAFKAWIRPEIYGFNGVATQLKTAPFRIIPIYYQSFWNWLLGLGPGHTIGRLGGWMLKDYASLLQPLGATTHPASLAVWQTYIGHWLDSTFFSPLWGWAGIWGDLGLLGLAAYLGIIILIWQHICNDDFSRFTILTMMIFGLILTQMEEPGYMLSMTTFIGLKWHENQIHRHPYLS